MTKLEKVIQAQILDYLVDRAERIGDVFVWRQNTGAAKTTGGGFVRFGRVGCPDILGVHLAAMIHQDQVLKVPNQLGGQITRPLGPVWHPFGQALGIEVKQEGANLDDDQIAFRADWERCGGLYVLARSVADAQRALGPEHLQPVRLLETQHPSR